MKRLHLFCFFVLFLAVFPFSAYSQVTTVAAWNLGGFNAIPQSRIDNQVRAIKKMNPDVMILSEVNPDSVATRIASQLGNNYKAVILRQTARQNLAVLYKTTACVVDVRLIPGSDDNNPDLRKAIAARVQIGNFDFMLIGVHLKSGRRTNGTDNPVPVRNRQARVIEQFISQAAILGERDYLVIGDYNMIPNVDTETFRVLSPGDGQNEILRYLSDSFAGQVSHIGSCVDGQARGNLLDGYAISRDTRELLANSLKLIPFSNTDFFRKSNNSSYSCTDYESTVSDHFPFVAQFRTNLPDDD